MQLQGLELDQMSAAQQVANALREYLLRGEIPPGAKLREVPLAAALGVSRHTLRSGFRILEVEGLLEHALHRGVVVPELSDERIADVFRARKALEFAGIHAIGAAGSSKEALKRMSSAVDRVAKSRSATELAVADLEFHIAVVSAINSRMITELYKNIQAQLRLTHAWAQRSRGNRGEITDTHRVVVNHLLSQNVDEAAIALMEINAIGEQRLLEAMRKFKVPPGSKSSVWPPEAE